MSHRILKGALCAILLVITVESCAENVTASLGCPALCSDESSELRDTILTASVVLDSTLVGFPQIGENRDITLLNRGDTADVRFIARFDTLPLRYLPAGASVDSAISRVDSATLTFLVDTLAGKPPITIEAYDVDTTATDTLPATLLPLFRAGRLLASQTFNAGDFAKDTVKLRLDNAKILKKVQDTLRLRIGLRITGAGSTRLRILGSAFQPRVRFRVSADTLVKPDTVFVRSKTPVDDASLQSALGVYSLIAKGALPTPPPGTIAVSGLSGARTYLRFDIPSSVIDSVQIVRASLLLTQKPSRGTSRTTDSVWVLSHPVLSAPALADVGTIMSFLGSPFQYGVDSVLFTPRDSGLKSIELVNLFRLWGQVGAKNSTRALVLRSQLEGGQAGAVEFHSLEAAANLRPRLRITYVPRRGFGIP